MPNGKGYKNRDEGHYQPAKLSDRERDGQANANYNGQPKNYETGAFGTNTEGSSYHDLGNKASGLHGNFAQKDEHMKMLKERGQEGQTIRHWNGTKGEGEFKTGNAGPTAYNSSPVPETYQPGTSNGYPPPMKTVFQNMSEKPTSFGKANKIDNTTDAMKKRVK